ncbi:MAG: archease [Brevinematia bacterium]
MSKSNSRSWEIHDHTADVIIEGKGKTLEKAFEGIALALQSVMVDISSVKPRKIIKECIELNSSSSEEQLFEFLSRIVFIKDVKKFFFSDVELFITTDNNKVKLCFTLKGERIDPKKHTIFTDVKGVSYSELKILNEKGYYICRCVVDV